MAIVSEFNFEGNGNDSVGANHGTLKNSPTFGSSLVTSEPGGQAIVLNGTNQYVEVPNGAALQITGSYSLTAWLERLTEAGDQTLLRKGTDYRLLMPAGDGLSLEHTETGGTEHECLVGTDIIPGRIYRVTGVYDLAAKSMYLFVNGRLLKTLGSVNAGPKSSTSALFLGSQSGTSRFWKGRNDKLVIRNSALSAAEELAEYRAQSPTIFEDGFETGDLSLWNTKQEVGGSLAVVGSEPTPAVGSKCLLATVNSKGERAEISPGHMDLSEGDEAFFRFRVWLKSSFPSSGWGTLVFQCRDEGNGSPVVALYVINGQFKVVGGPATGLSEVTYWNGPAAEMGRWYDFTIRVKFSENAEVGEVGVWMDGARQIQSVYKGKTAIGLSYPKWGLYRDSAIATAGSAAIDAISIARTASFSFSSHPGSRNLLGAGR